MKKLIIVTLITTCVALCAAVWPNNNATEQTPVPVAETAVSDQKATVAEIECKFRSVSTTCTEV